MRQLFSNFPPRIVSRKCGLPAVGGIHVGHCRGDAAFGHHRVRFAEQRFADDADATRLAPRPQLRREVPRRRRQ